MDYRKYSDYCFLQTTNYTLSSLVGKSEIRRWVNCIIKHVEKKKKILWRTELKKWLTKTRYFPDLSDFFRESDNFYLPMLPIKYIAKVCN